MFDVEDLDLQNGSIICLSSGKLLTPSELKEVIKLAKHGKKMERCDIENGKFIFYQRASMSLPKGVLD